MDFFTVFVGNFCPASGTGIGSEDDTAFEGETYNCGSGFGCLGKVGVIRGSCGGGVGVHLLDHGIAVKIIEGES